MKVITRYIGLDVHKDSITMAIAEPGPKGEIRLFGITTNDIDRLEKALGRIRKGHPGAHLELAYEAGPCRFVIARRLQQLQVPCLVAAMITVSELGDIHRFEHPRQLMTYLGLVPTESSSGPHQRQGGISRCGNSHQRWLLTECAEHYLLPPKVSKELSRRQEGQPLSVRACSNAAVSAKRPYQPCLKSRA